MGIGDWGLGIGDWGLGQDSITKCDSSSCGSRADSEAATPLRVSASKYYDSSALTLPHGAKNAATIRARTKTEFTWSKQA